MAISNYTELQPAIAYDMGRAATDTPQGNVTDYIAMAEAAINRTLRLTRQETSATVTLSSAASTAALPSGMLELLDFYYASDYLRPTQVALRNLTDTRSTTSGRPTRYALGATFVFNQAADQAYSLTCYYIAGWDIASDTTNWLLTNAPDLYVYMSLFYAYRATQNMEMAAGCKAIADECMKSVKDLVGPSRGKVVMGVDAGLLRARHFDINRG